MIRFLYTTLFLILLILSHSSCENQGGAADSPAYDSWSSYLGGPDRNHYTTLSEISPENLHRLEIAWSYKAPDAGQMQMNPIVVDSLLYGVTAALRVFALNAATGEEVWRFGDSLKVWHSTSRGVSYWADGDDKRIFFSRGSDLYALDALSGKPIASFGKGGSIDMRQGLPEAAHEKFLISNTPGTVYRDLIVMPLRVSEDVGAAPGDIMAFNTRTGDLEWTFRTIPATGGAGAESWEDPGVREKGLVGAANNWAGMAVDEKEGVLYVPTGSAAPDFYGGIRKGSNLYANCLLALKAETGELLWYYQFTHHDLWDRDPPAPPNLISVKRDGKTIPAVAQVTKQGYVYLFDRHNGQPLFEIREVPVPPSDLQGEEAWPTQPRPVAPKPFARQANELTENDISPYAKNPDSLAALLMKTDRRIYAPPSLDPVLLFPGYDGAAEWGGAGADPDKGILYVNSNEMAWILQMEQYTTPDSTIPAGQRLYTQFCAACHQQDRQGLAASGYPSLINIQNTLTKKGIAAVITQGKGMMTGFPQLTTDEKDALIAFLYEEGDKQEVADTGKPEINLPYKHGGYHKFLDSEGRPAISPPWGTLHAIDLNTGDYLWSVTLGDTPDLAKTDDTPTGTENYGGPVITQNGLLFIAATKDGYFRAFDKHSGKLLWEVQLPAPAFATPATYQVGGKQYIALACGGEKLGTKVGNEIIAFSLKEENIIDKETTK